MKKIFAALLLLSLFGGVILAQPKPPKIQKQKLNPEKMLLDLKNKLDLTDDQFSEIKTLVFNAEKQLIDVRAEQLEQKIKLMEKQKSIMEGTAEKIADLLNDTQLKLFEQMKSEREMMPPPPPPKAGHEMEVPPPPPPK